MIPQGKPSRRNRQAHAHKMTLPELWRISTRVEERPRNGPQIPKGRVKPHPNRALRLVPIVVGSPGMRGRVRGIDARNGNAYAGIFPVQVGFGQRSQQGVCDGGNRHEPGYM